MAEHVAALRERDLDAVLRVKTQGFVRAGNDQRRGNHDRIAGSDFDATELVGTFHGRGFLSRGLFGRGGFLSRSLFRGSCFLGRRFFFGRRLGGSDFFLGRSFCGAAGRLTGYHGQGCHQQQNH